MSESRPFETMSTPDLVLLAAALQVHDPGRASPADGGAVVRRLLTDRVLAEIRERQMALGPAIRRVLDDGLARLRQSMTMDEVIEVVGGG